MIEARSPQASHQALLASLLLLSLACACGSKQSVAESTREAQTEPIDVALTFDDLPSHGPLPPGVTRRAIVERLVQALDAHRAPAVAFVNGIAIGESEDCHAGMQAWLASGRAIGNHTFSHERIDALGLDAYLAGIDRNADVLRAWTRDRPGLDARRFRYPFLDQGDASTRDAIRAHLRAQGLGIAEVTIDFGDWAWNPAYARCAERNDSESIESLRALLLDHAGRSLVWAVETARALYGRPIPHVLLLHVGAFDAEVLDALLSSYEARGVRFVPLEQALADPAYAEDTRDASGSSNSLLEQALRLRPTPHPPWVQQPRARLDAMCR